MLLGDPRSPTACPFRSAPRSGHPTTSVSTRSACPFRHRCPHAAPCSVSCRRPALTPHGPAHPPRSARLIYPCRYLFRPLPGASRRGPAPRHGPRLIHPCRHLFREPPAGDAFTRSGPRLVHPLRAGTFSGQREPPRGTCPPATVGSAPRSPGPPPPPNIGNPREGPAHPLQSAARLAHPGRHLLRTAGTPARDLPTRRSQCVSLSRIVPPPLRTLVGPRSHWLTATVSGPLPHTASALPPGTGESRARPRFHPPEITSGESREARGADNLIHPQSAC